MATVIDSLLIELGLDAKKFSKAANQSVKDLRNIEAQARRAFRASQQESNNLGDSFGKAKDALTALGVTILSFKGMQNLVGQTNEVNASLNRTASRFNMSEAELNAWGQSLKRYGGTADDFVSSMQAINTSIANIDLAGSPAIFSQLQQFQNAGANMTGVFDEANRKINFDKLADQIKYLTSIGKENEAFVAATNMGISEPLFQALKKGGDSYRELRNEVKRLSGVTKENTEEAQKVKDAWADVDTAFQGVARSITSQLNPAQITLANTTQNVLEKFVEWDKVMNGGLSNAVIGASAIGTVAGAAKLLGVNMSAIIGLATPFLFFLEKAIPLVGAAAGIFSLTNPIMNKSLGGGSSHRFNLKTGKWEKNESNQNSSNQNFYESNQNFSYLEKKYGLPDGMLDKIWAIESNRGKSMVSPAGATGHFQFMPATAKAYGLTREDTFDLNKSSEAAARMLSDLLKQNNGDVNKALASYNWGSGNVARYGMSDLPKETQNYLSKYHQGNVGANSTVPQTQTAGNNSKYTGEDAMANLLMSYVKSGNNTISAIIGKWSPAGGDGAANTNAYIANVEKATGIDSNKVLNPNELLAVQRAMTNQEGMIGPRATVPQTQSTSNNNSTEVKINNQNIYTQATDANGIAKSMYEELKNNQLTSFGTVAYQ